MSCVPVTRRPIDNAICATSNTRLSRDSAGVVSVAPRETANAWSGARAVTRNAGTRPDAPAHTTAVRSANAATVASIGIDSDRRPATADSTTHASGTATTVAASASTRLSISR